jgi:hypothetical protein
MENFDVGNFLAGRIIFLPPAADPPSLIGPCLHIGILPRSVPRRRSRLALPAFLKIVGEHQLYPRSVQRLLLRFHDGAGRLPPGDAHKKDCSRKRE